VIPFIDDQHLLAGSGKALSTHCAGEASPHDQDVIFHLSKSFGKMRNSDCYSRR
jgi:hypothetical protein